MQTYRKCLLWVGKKSSIDIQGRISSKSPYIAIFLVSLLTYLYHVLLPNQDRIFVESGAPILDLWLVIKCLTSVIKSIQEMQMCRQMGVWTSVEVQCTIARMRVSRRLKSGPVRPSTRHSLEVWTSVEVFKSKCWVVQCMAPLGGVEVWVRVKKPYLPPTPGPRTRSRPRPKLILFHTLTHSIYYTAIPHSWTTVNSAA